MSLHYIQFPINSSTCMKNKKEWLIFFLVGQISFVSPQKEGWKDDKSGGVGQYSFGQGRKKKKKKR